MSLQQPVGLNDNGSFAANLALDQQQVAELLLSIPLVAGGLSGSDGPVIDIPTPFVNGAPSAELVGGIQVFQELHSALLNVDLRVDPNGQTWQLLVQLANQPAGSTDPIANIVLDAMSEVLEEVPPTPVAGLPSIVYTAADTEQLVFDDGAVRVTMSFHGLLTGNWGQSFGIACLSSPSFLALDQAVKSGNARRIGATALDQACNELRAQTRFAANNLFASVAISADAQGTFSVSGSIGDRWRQVSVGFVFPNTIVAVGSITISQLVPLPAIGGEVKFSGTMACTIKAMFRDQLPPEPASIFANLAVALIAGRVVLVPLAAWIAEGTTVEAARQLVLRTAAGILGERVLLGPSPAMP